MSVIHELVEVLEAMAARKGEADPRDLVLDIAERIVKGVGSVFGSRQDEVAILLLTSDDQHLRFVAPRKFVDLGTIPITKRDSIAVSVFGSREGEAMNNVPTVRHVAFFESVKLRDKTVPIQKMITVPILQGNAAIGVAQISRKGDTPSEAGPDFTSDDVAKAQALFKAVAVFLADARPEKF